MDVKRIEIKEGLKILFLKLKKINSVYAVASEEQKGKLLAASEKTFIELEELGVDKVFSESLVVSGKAFVDSLFDSRVDVISLLDGADYAEIVFNS